jgi:hypothetical protein
VNIVEAVVVGCWKKEEQEEGEEIGGEVGDDWLKGCDWLTRSLVCAWCC